MAKIGGNVKIKNLDIDLETVGKNCVYSTSEQVVGKYIDNRPIYKITFDGVYNDGAVLLNNVSKIVNCYGEGDPGTGRARQLPYFEIWNNSIYCCKLERNPNNQIVIDSRCAGSSAYCNLTATIEYTKTTD